MNCKKCGNETVENDEYCIKCSAEETSVKSHRSSFWGELEKNQTAIEDFGYKVKTEIRKSENTVIYIASNDDETVTIKRITVSCNQSGIMLSEDELAEKIRSEMESLSKISSGLGERFVITYYDYKLVESEDNLKYDLYIRMDYLTSLAQRCKEANLKVKDLLEMGADICDALEWCHSNNRVHNNLNLNNIFINDDGRYVLGDFASFVNEQNEVEYCIAPELFYRNNSPSESTDIYSLGMVMFVLLNKGMPPFATIDNPDDLSTAVSRLRRGEIPTLPLSINYRLSDLVYQAISKKEKRFKSVAEMKKAINALLKEMPDEWLSQNINDIESSNEGSLSTPEPDVDKKKFEKKEKKEKSVPRELAPEEVEMKKKNIKDFWLLGLVLVVLIAAITVGTVFLYNSGNREIYSLIESESYAVAFKEISALHDEGKNVDDLLRAYIEACLEDFEYKRVVQAIPLFSEKAFDDTTYFLELYFDIANSGKEKQAKEVFDFLYKKENLRIELDKTLAQG